MGWVFYAFATVLFGLNLEYASGFIRCNSSQQCIPVTSCPELLAMFSTAAGIKHVQGLTCGFSGLNAKVCCDKSPGNTPPTPPPPTVVIPTIGVTPVTNDVPVTPNTDVMTPVPIPVTPVTNDVPPKTDDSTPVPNDVTPTTNGVTPATKGVTPVISLRSDLLPSQCGSIGDRVFGGTELPLRSYMWLALFDYGTRTHPDWACGGSLISERYVVTAAHCIDNEIKKYNSPKRPITRIRLGEHDTSKDRDCEQFNTGEVCAPPVQDFAPEHILMHPTWRKRVRNSDDIALIRLDRPAKLNRYVQPICLPPPDLDIFAFLGERNAEVAGWGYTENGTSSNVKLMVEVPFVDLETCRDIFSNEFNVKLLDKGQICFGGEKGKDSCQGDSGGPLVGTDTNPESAGLVVLLGVVSYGAECGSMYPAIYTEVSQYRNWIIGNLRP